MFRVLECRGILHEIEVKQVDQSRLIPSRFDTENDGVSVTMTGGIAYPHVPERLRIMWVFHSMSMGEIAPKKENLNLILLYHK